MEYESHGGGCCGYGHIFNFDNATIEDLEDMIARHERNAGGINRILEAILSERQLTGDRWAPCVRGAGGWANVLASKGFRLAAEWNNSNTGRRCFQFLRIPVLLTEDAGYHRPFAWEGPFLPPGQPFLEPPRLPGPVEIRNNAPPPPPPAAWFTEYYATLREGGRRGPFATAAAARQAYPRCRQFERRIIMNDGSSRWNFID